MTTRGKHAGERTEEKMVERGIAGFLVSQLSIIFRPTGGRAGVFGFACSFGGYGGVTGSLMDGKGALIILGQVAIGMVGTYIMWSCLESYYNEP